MPSISANAMAQVSLAAGQSIKFAYLGAGYVTFGSGSFRQGQVWQINGGTTVGPFPANEALTITCTSGVLQYVSGIAAKAQRIGIMGDSIASQNTLAASYGYPANGWLNWAQARLGHPWYCPMANNFAAFGSSTDAVVNNQLPLVLSAHAFNPISRMFISTGTNDNGAGLTLAKRKYWTQNLFDQLLAAGIAPAFIGILPRGNDGSLSSAKKQNMHLNEWAQWFAYTRGGLEFIDCSVALANTANGFGNALAGLTDGTQLHPIDPGAFHMGKIIADYYSARGVGSAFRAANQAGDSYDATDNPTGIVFDGANPFMTGGGAGTAPTGMTISPATAAWQWGGTRTLPNGQTRPIGVLTLGATANHFLYQDAVATGAFDTENIRTGDYVYTQAEVVLTNTVNVTNMNLQLAESDGSTTVDSRFLTFGSGNQPDITGPLTLYLRSAPVPIRSWSGSGSSSVFVKLNVGTSSGSGTVQVNSFEMRKWNGEI